MLNNKWSKILSELDYAFQPIVNCYSGKTYGVEALLRGTDRAGFSDIHGFFDEAHSEGYLSQIDFSLRNLAIRKFATIPFHGKIKLFYNYDPRIIEMPDYRSGETEHILSEYGLSNCTIFFELTEKYSVKSVEKLRGFIGGLKKRNIKIALDDFGSGFAGLELLYHSEPELIKFDRFLISGLNTEVKKKNFCSHILSISKSLSIINLAEGIETEKELITCKDLHFDLLQGFFIAKPVLDTGELKEIYPHVAKHESRRNGSSIESHIEKEITHVPPVRIDEDIRTVIEKFRKNHSFSFLPVVDMNDYPVGIINEEPLKKYLYHPYGYSLISNHAIGKLANFIENVPAADIKSDEDSFLSIFASSQFSQGIIVTKELKYFGFLTLNSFISILNEKKMYIARESNPLTKLPGNNLINEKIHSVLKNNPEGHILAYWDMDNFKPFNDKYGFRQGDRVILFFADLLRTSFDLDVFNGHIGGDDFFTSFDLASVPEEKAVKSVEIVVSQFADSIASIHSREDFERGYYISRDRNNHTRKIPLLSVSCALIRIKPFTAGVTAESICNLIAEGKKKAKKSRSGIALLDAGSD